jgi:hypothetical protein
LRLVIRSRDVQRVRAAQDWLAGAGVDAQGLAGEASQCPAPEGEDVRLVFPDEAIAQAPGAAAATLALQPWSADVVSPTLGIDGHLWRDGPASLAARLIADHDRAGLSRWELEMRRATAADRGFLTPPAWPDHAPVKMLFVGRPGPAFLAYERAAEGLDAHFAASLTTFAAFDLLHDEAFDAIILDGGEDPGQALSLSGALRRNADLQPTPTLFILRKPDADLAEKAVERGATVLCAALNDARQALLWLTDAARRERRRRNVDRQLAAIAARVGGDAEGLLPKAFFESHLTRVAMGHHACGRDLALAVIAFAAAPGARARPTPAGQGAEGRRRAGAPAAARLRQRRRPHPRKHGDRPSGLRRRGGAPRGGSRHRGG